MDFQEFLFGRAPGATDRARETQQQHMTQYTGQVGQALQPFEALKGQVPDDLFGEYVRRLTSTDPLARQVTPQTQQYRDPLSAVDSFLDPSIAYAQDQARRQVEASAAGRGGLYSGGAARELADRSGAIAASGWGTAFDRAMQDDAARRGVTQQNFQNELTAGQYNTGLDSLGLERFGQATNTSLMPTNVLAQSQMDLYNTLFGANTGLTQQQLQADMNDRGIAGDVIQGGAQVLGAWLGGGA